MMKGYLQLFCWLLLIQVNCQELSRNSSKSFKNQENQEIALSKFEASLLASKLLSNSQPDSRLPGRSLVTCYSGCESCETSYFYGCTSCSNNYILWQSMCVLSCPTGWVLSSGTCVLDHEKIFYFTFYKIQGYFDFPSDSLSLVCGNSAINFYPDYDNNDPFPSNSRGYYFDPSKSYMQLPPNSWSKDDLILSYHHTIALWLWRRDTSFSEDYLLYKEARSGNSLFYVTISPSKLTYNFMVNGIEIDTYTDTWIKMTFTIEDPRQKWTALAICFSYDNEEYTINFFENNNQFLQSSSKPGWSHPWYPETKFLLGYVNDSQLGFDGWIAEFGIYSKAYSSVEFLYAYCPGCSVCPVSTRYCFPTCDFSTFDYGDYCKPCAASCTSPCVYTDRCDLCNANCGESSLSCNGFSSSDCVGVSCSHCLTCGGNEFYDCFTCDANHYLYKGICIITCPGTSKEQPLSGGYACTKILSYDFELTATTGNSFADISNNYYIRPSTSYNKYIKSYDPIPSYKRGFYFNGITSFLSTDMNPMRFDIDQTHSFWLKSQSLDTQTLLQKLYYIANTFNLQLQIVNMNLNLKIRLSTQDADSIYENTISSISVTQDVWGLFYVIIRFIRGYTYWKMCANNACSEFSQLGAGYYYDNITTTYYGQNLFNTKENFKGFIWEIMYDPTIWSFNQISNTYKQGDCTNEGCDLCLYNNKCLVDCDWNEFYDENAKSCQPCSYSCNYGCRNAQSCNFCEVTACELCDTFSSTTCNQCYSGAILSPEHTSCDCPSGSQWDSQTNSCLNSCYSTCSKCTSTAMDQCASCKSGYKFYNNFCVKNCPIGYYIEQNSCFIDNQGSLVINFEFTKIDNTQYDSVSSYPIYMGTTDEYYPNYDINDPWILPYRGLYFRARSIATLNVLANSQASKVSLGLNHTIDIWTMVESSISSGYIFGIYLSDDALLYIEAIQLNSTHFSYSATYNLQSLDGNSKNQFFVKSSFYEYFTWQRVIVAYSCDNNGSALKMFINAQPDGSSTLARYCFDDNFDYSISLGNTWSNFIGYVYSLKLYNYAKISVDSWTSSCGYPYCTENNDKLIICGKFNYYDEASKTCESCDERCRVGCIRSDNKCNLNQDPLCDTYTGLKPSECTQCKAGSTKGPPCACNNGYMYDSTTESCACKTGYQYIDGKCVSCNRYLQPSEISGYFTSTFARVVVDLAIPVNTTDLTCEKVFTFDTIEKFGSGYVCYFDSQAKEIIIDLGDSFTLANELIKIIDGALFGLELNCGYFSYSLETTLTYSATLQYPIAKIDAPSTVLYNCQNLTISGKKSRGSIKSSLYYKWSVTSEPSLSSSSKYNTDFQQTISEFTILQSELSTATITVTLTVKNKFNNENTASLTIISIPDGFTVNFDKTIDYQSAAPDWKTYGIGSISSCNAYNNLSLKWKLANVNGNYSVVNEDAIWGNQTKVSTLNIPSKVLWPYTNATFSLEAADSTLNLAGSGSFEVSIIPNPPIIEFSRTNGSADISSSFFINANSSYDPNEDKNLSYEWTCTQANSDCRSLISNTKAENFTISKNTLQSGKEYEFALSALADFSSRRRLRDDRFLSDKSSQTKEIITISTVDYSIPTVNIISPLSQSQPTIITANTMVLFQATTEGDSETQYTYQWSVDNTATIRFSSPLNQLSISIVEGTLETRHSYTLTLTVSENSKYSYYTYQFYVNSPPYSGSLAATPSSGIELETVFKMEALEWVDDENNLPLSYSFGYFSENSEIYLNFKNQSLTYFSTFPYLGDNITVFVDIYDNLGAYSTKNASIEISVNKNLDQKELYSNYKNYINSIVSNPQSYPGVISALCDSILNRDYWLNGKFNVPSSYNLPFYEEIIESALSWTEDLINASQIDSQSISIFSALLSRIVLNPYLNSSSTEKKVCDMIISVFNKIPVDQMLEKEQPFKYFIVTNEAFLYNSSSLVAEKDDLENAIEALSSIEKLVLSQMIVNEVRNVTVNKFGITMAVMLLSALDGYKFVSSNDKASIAFSDNFSSEISSITDEKVVNLALSVLDCPNNPNNLSSSIVDFTMYGHSSNQKISVNLTDTNILIQIPVWNIKYSNYTPECVFLDTKTMNWSTEGCTKYKINSYDIVCSCNHFTTFTALNAASSSLVDSNIGDTVNAAAWSKINSSNAIGLYFCIATLIVYGILGILAYKKDRKEEKKEEENRRKLMGDPKKLAKVATKLTNADDTDEPIEYERKKKCWPYKKHDQETDYSEPDKSFQAPEVVFVYSFTDQGNSENTTEGDSKYSQIKKWAQFTIEKHELLNIMFIREPERPSFSRITLFFFALLGQMFFIGMFYQDAHSSNDEIVTNNSTNASDLSSNSTNSADSSDSLVSYSWNDFWIMIWSSLFMIIITVILNKFLREKLLDDKMTEIQFRAVRKQNKIKRWVGIILAWGIMFYFCWSIALFAIQFKQSISKIWVLNTGISYSVDIFITSILKKSAIAFITIKIIDWYERYKVRKYREKNELDSDEGTETTPTSVLERKRIS